MRWFRALCLFSLAAFALGALALFAPFWLGLCDQASGGAVSCAAPIYRRVYELGFLVVFLSLRWIAPAALAAIGLFMLGFDAVSRRR